MSIETSGRRAPSRYEPPLVSWEEYLPWALANEFPSEWVDGRIVDVLPQNLRSNLIVQYFLDLIGRHVQSPKRGRVIFNFLMWLPDRPSGRVPDLMFISEERLGRVTDTYLDGPADLAIEVVSVDSLVRDQRDKFLEYEAAGVREYWLINEHHETARFYILGTNGQYQEAALCDDGTYASVVLPGLRLPIKRLWHEPFAPFREDLAGRSPDPTLPVRRASPADRVPPSEQPAARSPAVSMKPNGRRVPTDYAPPLVSWEDFHDWALSHEHRVEWVDGEIIELPPDSVEHFDEVDFLSDLIKTHVRRGALGRVFYSTVLMRLPNRPTGRVPDIMFVSNEHLDRVRRTYLDGPADLVIEIVSPDSEIRDRFLKLGEYAEAGIPEYWLIDKSRHEAHFYLLGNDGQYHEAAISDEGIYTSVVLPGLRLRVEWLWGSRPPTLDEALADLPD